MAKANDFFYKNFVVSLLTFLLLEAFLLESFKNVRHIYLVAQLVVLFYLSVESEGQVTTTASSHVLMTFVSLTIAYIYISPAT